MNSHYRAGDRPANHLHKKLAAAGLAPMAAAATMILNQPAQWALRAFKAWTLGSSPETLMLTTALTCASWLLSLLLLVRRELTRGKHR